MAAVFHLDPDRMLAHAATAADLSERLCRRRRVTALPGQELPGAVDSADLRQLEAAVGRAARELAELSAVLAAVAVNARAADDDLARALGAVRDGS